MDEGERWMEVRGVSWPVALNSLKFWAASRQPTLPIALFLLASRILHLAARPSISRGGSPSRTRSGTHQSGQRASCLDPFTAASRARANPPPKLAAARQTCARPHLPLGILAPQPDCLSRTRPAIMASTSFSPLTDASHLLRDAPLPEAQHQREIDFVRHIAQRLHRVPSRLPRLTPLPTLTCDCLSECEHGLIMS